MWPICWSLWTAQQAKPRAGRNTEQLSRLPENLNSKISVADPQICRYTHIFRYVIHVWFTVPSHHTGSFMNIHLISGSPNSAYWLDVRWPKKTSVILHCFSRQVLHGHRENECGERSQGTLLWSSCCRQVIPSIMGDSGLPHTNSPPAMEEIPNDPVDG